MRQSLMFMLLFSSQTLFSQYKIDTTVKKGYFKTLAKLPQQFKDEFANRYKDGLCLLYDERVDTLNKNELNNDFNSIKSYLIDPLTRQVDTIRLVSAEQEQITRSQPLPLSCNCSLRDDTLTIISEIHLFSGFTIITKLFKGEIRIQYSEVDSEERTLRQPSKKERTNMITIPAKVSFIALDRKPKSNLKELFGQISIITSGYYSYINVSGFKNDYIHKRMKYGFYFRCNMKNSIQL